MKDKDSKLIWESLYENEEDAESSDKKNILSKLQTLDQLLPDDAMVQWSIQNGSFGSVNPHHALGLPAGPNRPEAEHYTIRAFVDLLKKIWSDDEFAREKNLFGADWSGKQSYSGTVWWTANDTHYQDVFGRGAFDQLQNLTPEHKEPYRKFHRAKHLTDGYVKAFVNNKEPRHGEPSPEDWEHQKDWRIVISPDSKDISDAAGRTAHDVYPKLYNKDGSRKGNTGGAYVGD